MRVLVLGANGQLGNALGAVLSGEVVKWTHGDLDITDTGQSSERIATLQPDIIINAAAYTAVDKAETDAVSAWQVNATGPANIARAAAGIDVPLVHISTDHVFGGTYAHPWTESDAPFPRGVYAQTKLAGEYQVRANCPRHFVLRTCGLYGTVEDRHPNNFVETILRLASERDELAVVDDQICTPTSTRSLARWINLIIRTDHYGLYHATASGGVSWFEFAKAVLSQSGVETPVRPITSAEFNAAAQRPENSVLDCSLMGSTFGIVPQSWEESLYEYLRETGRIE